jgi:hypothetical protein
VNAGLWALIGAVIGAFLGFGGTYILQRLAENRRRKQLRTVARNIIGSEIIHNLGIIEHMEKSATEVIENISLKYQITIPIRSEVFNRFLDLSSLSVLDNLEQKFFIEIFTQLNLVTREYASWPEKIGQVILNQDSKKLVSQNLLNYITILRKNLVNLLCEICLREKEGLQEKQLKDIYHKLKKLDYTQIFSAGKSSDYKQVKQGELGQFKYFVVWKNDWPECPLEVIELGPSKEVNSL